MNAPSQPEPAGPLVPGLTCVRRHADVAAAALDDGCPLDPIDAAHLAELVRLFGRRRVVDLMRLCIGVLGQGQDDLASARAEGDFEAIAKQSHRLYSTAGNFGLIALVHTVRVLESTAHRADIRDVDVLCARFADLLPPTFEHLTALLSAKMD